MESHGEDDGLIQMLGTARSGLRTPVVLVILGALAFAAAYATAESQAAQVSTKARGLSRSHS